MDWTQLLVVGFTAAVGFVTWGLNERSKRRFEDYTRREARYVQLVRSLRGFHVRSEDHGAKETFLSELELCWLYGSDDVVRAAYAFLQTVKTAQRTSDEERRVAVGNLVAAIRGDLLRRAPLKRTSLKASEFELLKVS